MRIAIDARALLGEQTGIGTYTRALARGLAERGDSVGLFLPRPPGGGADGLGPVSVHADRERFGMLWMQRTLPRRVSAWKADALLAALTIGPARSDVPYVSVVHDLTPWTNPEWHARRTLLGFVPLWERTLENAVRLLCVSHATASELESRYPDARDRVRVVCNGVDPEFTPGSGDASAGERVRKTYARGERFLLYLGTLEPRKNLETLLAACERLWSEKPERPGLVLAGGVGWKTATLLRKIERSPHRDRIRLAGYASREAARELYRACDAFVYPSLAEGFGLPVLEAMACGAPVIASDTPALREVGGDAALYAPALEAGALAERIARVLEDAALQAALRAAGPIRAARFSWRTTVEKTAAVLAEAAAA